MKKTVSIILLVFLVIIISIYMNYKQKVLSTNETKKFNEEFEFYNKEEVLGTDITTVINKAIDNNEKCGIAKDEKGIYIANEKNSIKIYIYMIINDTTYPMEQLVNKSLSDFTKYFGEVKFSCTDVKYHKKTGQIAEMTFASTEY